jgi:selenocysteine lyase/cysteine desulfurase
MKASILNKSVPQDVFQLAAEEKTSVQAGFRTSSNELFEELERGVFAALETYSNVHRGSGHNSIVTTALYEQARKMILEHFGLSKKKYTVIFCTPRRAEILIRQIPPQSFRNLSSHDIGLPVGVRVIAVEKRALRVGIHFESGGGTARLVSTDWVIWAKSPERYEAGTPAIINIIALTNALKLLKQLGEVSLRIADDKRLTANQILYSDELNDFCGRELLCKLNDTLIGSGLVVHTTEGNKPYINLDNGASNRTFTPVWKTVLKTWHQRMEVQLEIVDKVRKIISEFVGAPLSEYDVIFTSNTTEAINITAESFYAGVEKDTVVLNTILEHNSNDLPWRKHDKISLVRIKADYNGFIDLKDLETLLAECNEKAVHGVRKIRLVTVSGASNVLGTFNDLEAISRIVRKYGALMLVDAAQMIAHRKVEMEKWGIDYLAFSAHKVYAPFGTGVLVARKGLLGFSPEEMEGINLSGVENPGGIAGLGKSLLLLQRIGIDLIQEEEKKLTEYALRCLSKIRGLRIYGIKDPESPDFISKGGVISFSMKKQLADKVAGTLAVRGGIGVRSGCHCAHLLVKHLVGVPPFLEQFQGFILRLFPKVSLPGIVRISFGIENNRKEIDTLISELQRIV